MYTYLRVPARVPIEPFAWIVPFPSFLKLSLAPSAGHGADVRDERNRAGGWLERDRRRLSGCAGSHRHCDQIFVQRERRDASRVRSLEITREPPFRNFLVVEAGCVSNDASRDVFDSLLGDEVREAIHRRRGATWEKFSGERGIAVAPDVEIAVERSVGSDRRVAKRVRAEVIVRAKRLERDRTREELHRRGGQHLVARIQGVQSVAAGERNHHRAPRSAAGTPREASQRRRDIGRAPRHAVTDYRDGRHRPLLGPPSRVVVVFLVCASTIVGVAPQTVSATRMAIWILRENIYPFFNCDFDWPDGLLNGEKGAIARARSLSNMRTADRLEYTREEGIFPRSKRESHRIRSMNG